MNKYALTTVAAIPSTGGQASSLPPEVDKPDIMKQGEEKLNALGYLVKDGQIERTVQMITSYFAEYMPDAVLTEITFPAIDLGFVGGTNADENQG